MLLPACKNKATFDIKCNIRCAGATTAYLIEKDEILGTEKILDSANASSGKFHLKGHVNEPTVCRIKLGNRNSVMLFVENSDIEVRGSMNMPDNIQISGSQTDKDLRILIKEEKRIKSEKNITWLELIKAKNEKNRKEIKKLEKIYNSYNDSIYTFTKDFVYLNSKSMGATYYVYYLMVNKLYDIKKIEKIASMFDKSLSKTKYLKYITDEITLNQKLSLNTPAENFSINTANHDTIKLSDFRGRYVFLNFTSSWCNEHHKRNKTLKEIYKSSKDKLEIISIFLDKDEKSWRNCIEKDSTDWINACDFMYWESSVTKQFRVNEIPYGILIDTSGMVSAINPSFRQIQQKTR